VRKEGNSNLKGDYLKIRAWRCERRVLGLGWERAGGVFEGEGKERYLKGVGIGTKN